MKTSVFTFLFLIGFLFLSADPHDAYTQADAEKLAEFVLKERYIIAYCPPCDNDVPKLIRIDKVEVVVCDWDETRFSVKYYGESYQGFDWDEKRLSVESEGFAPQKEEGIVYGNYMYASAKRENAKPLDCLSEVKEQWESTDCKNTIGFPSKRFYEIDAPYEQFADDKGIK